VLESCRRSSDVNFHFWLWAASSTNVRCRALRAAWTISVSSKSLMLRRIGTWKLMGARSIRNVIRTCASCSPRASPSMRATVILNLLIPSLGLPAQTNIDPNVVTQPAVRPRRHACRRVLLFRLKTECARIRSPRRCISESSNISRRNSHNRMPVDLRARAHVLAQMLAIDAHPADVLETWEAATEAASRQ
jgi:hypothetical protein